jgi:anti-sigma B factor antagonist
MNLLDNTINGILILTIDAPQLDYASADDFKLGVANRVRQGSERLILDMNQVNFMDSSGLGALVACLKLLGDPKRMPLCNVAPAVLSLLKLTRMDQVFLVYPSAQAAVEAWQP